MDNGLHDHRAIMVTLTRRVILISEDAICRHRPHLHRTTITSTRHVHSPLQPSRPGLSRANVSKLRYSGGSVGQAFLTGHHMTSTAAVALICLLTHSSKLSSNRMVMATRLLTGRDSLADLPTTAALMSLSARVIRLASSNCLLRGLDRRHVSTPPRRCRHRTVVRSPRVES